MTDEKNYFDVKKSTIVYILMKVYFMDSAYLIQNHAKCVFVNLRKRFTRVASINSTLKERFY